MGVALSRRAELEVLPVSQKVDDVRKRRGFLVISHAAEIARAQSVLEQAGRTQDDYRNFRHIRARPLQHLQSTHPGHFNIEEDQSRHSGLAFYRQLQISDSLLSSGAMDEVPFADPTEFEGSLQQKRLVGVVINMQQKPSCHKFH